MKRALVVVLFCVCHGCSGFAIREETSFREAKNFDSPFVVRGGCKNSDAFRKWDEKYLRKHLNLNANAVVEYYENRKLLGRLNITSIDEFYKTMKELELHEAIYLREFPISTHPLASDFGPHLDTLLAQFIYLGDAFSPFHWHSSCSNAILHQIRGEKVMYFIPPRYYLPSQSYFSQLIQELPLEYNEILKECQNMTCAVDQSELNMSKVILYPGDSLFIPPHFWHNASGSSGSISLVQKYKRNDLSYVSQDFRFFISCYIGPIYRYIFPHSDEL
jgi:hypothetical protein